MNETKQDLIGPAASPVPDPDPDAPADPATRRATLHRFPARAARPRTTRTIALVLWILAIITIPVWSHSEDSAWDAKIYLTAVHSLQLGHDPWGDGIAIQQQAHATAKGPSPQGPFSYVYSPITLPVLRLAAATPLWLTATVFWLFYVAGVLGALWFGVQAQTPQERRTLAVLTPLAVFFPGFLACDTILSGNVAFMLYGLVLTTAVLAWRRGRWRWFYLAILAASCFKAPLLSLLAIPILSARKQWLPAALTAAAGVGLFAMQPFLWPAYFHNYLQAVELQFSYNRDFGFSPAGLFSGVLFDHHLPYSPACTIFYLLYAIPLFAFLFVLSRRYLGGAFTLMQWTPVMIVGVILLNPRLIEYDAAPVALPLALIAWRFFSSFASPRLTAICFSLLFIAANALALVSWSMWKLTEGPLLVVFFAAGAYTLLHPRSAASLDRSSQSEVILLHA